jgi:putative peptide zinc metalloprotease protein
MASQFSQLWYRVENLRARLRPHAEIHRHIYRGRLWYVMQDHSAGRFHRFTPAAHFVIALMDGSRTVRAIWEAAGAQLGEDAPSQDEVIRLLGQLHAADLLQSDVPPDTAEILERYEKQTRRERTRSLLSPLAIRIPLFDPDRFLARLAPWVAPAFGGWGAILWCLVVGTGLALAARYWPELSRNVADTALAPGNLLLLWLTFPVIKALHELGHAFAVKAWDGEVHDMGIMLLVFMPVPYVDASASSALRERRRRVVVGAAGMAVELFVASLALMLWINLEPGLTRSIAYNVMLIAGVSTVLFNANPLMRFDGYYILSDLLEIPNLAQRANRYLGYLAERYLLRLKGVEPFEAAPGERPWFVFYAIASYCYRLFIVIGIALFVAGEFFIAGVVLAIWAVATMVLLPLGKLVVYLWSSPKLGERRARAVAVSAVVALALAVALFALPAPLRTQAEGVVWVPDEAEVRAGGDGFVVRLLAQPGSQVESGELLARAENPVLQAAAKALAARVSELEARYQALWRDEPAQAQVVREQLIQERAKLARALERVGQLEITSRARGVLVVPRAPDWPGRFVRQGELIGYVLGEAPLTARVVVPQDDIDLVRQRTRRVEVRLASHVARVHAARILREVPAASEQLPSKALGPEGGGNTAIDPRDPGGTKVLSRRFQFDVELPRAALAGGVGTHAYVRFDHGWEPLGLQGYRRLRQVFLSALDV